MPLVRRFDTRMSKGRRSVKARLDYIEQHMPRRWSAAERSERFKHFLVIYVGPWLRMGVHKTYGEIRREADMLQDPALERTLPWLWKLYKDVAESNSPLDVGVHMHQFLGQYGDVRDWILAVSPPLPATWAEAARLARAWHQQLEAASRTQDRSVARRIVGGITAEPVQLVEDVPGWEGAYWLDAANLDTEAIRAIGHLLGHCYSNPITLTSYLSFGAKLFFLFDTHGRPKLALHATSGREPRSVPRLAMRVGEVRVAQNRIPPEEEYGLLLYRALPRLDWTLRFSTLGSSTFPGDAWPPGPRMSSLGTLSYMAFPGPKVICAQRHHVDGDEAEEDNPPHWADPGDVGHIGAHRRRRGTAVTWQIDWDKGGSGYYDSDNPGDMQTIIDPRPLVFPRDGDVYTPQPR